MGATLGSLFIYYMMNFHLEKTPSESDDVKVVNNYFITKSGGSRDAALEIIAKQQDYISKVDKRESICEELMDSIGK